MGKAVAYRVPGQSVGGQVAIKIVDKSSIADVDDVERVCRETFILTSLKHENIIRLYEVNSQDKLAQCAQLHLRRLLTRHMRCCWPWSSRMPASCTTTLGMKEGSTK